MAITINGNTDWSTVTLGANLNDEASAIGTRFETIFDAVINHQFNIDGIIGNQLHLTAIGGGTGELLVTGTGLGNIDTASITKFEYMNLSAGEAMTLVGTFKATSLTQTVTSASISTTDGRLTVKGSLAVDENGDFHGSVASVTFDTPGNYTLTLTGTGLNATRVGDDTTFGGTINKFTIIGPDLPTPLVTVTGIAVTGLPDITSANFGEFISAFTNNDSISGGTGNDLLQGFAGKDTLLGMAGNDTLDGGADNDSMDGGAGNDSYVGGAGDDTYVIAQAGDTIDASGDSTGDIDTVRLAIAAHALHDLSQVAYANLENITFTGTGAVTLIGNTSVNTLVGGAGNDSISGGGSHDVLMGNAGNDTLDGGTSGDAMNGGAGNDYYVIDDVGDSIFDTAGTGDAVEVVGVGSGSLLDYTGIESLVLNGGSGTGAGSTAANVLGSLNGNHTLVGLAGNDTYNISFGDHITEDVGTTASKDLAKVSLNGGDVFVLDNNVENLTLFALESALQATANDSANSITGSGVADSINGAGGNDTILGGIGNDTLDGGDGKDTMAGGVGDDVYHVQVINPTATTLAVLDAFAEAANAGNDTVLLESGILTANTTALAVTLAANVENLDASGVDAAAKLNFTGNALNNTIVGTLGANKIDGGAGNDSIDAEAGNDTVLGGAGNDTINACGGNDTVDGGAGNDQYIEDEGDDSYLFSQLTDTITTMGGANDGIDTAVVAVANHDLLDVSEGFSFIENVTYTGAGNATLTGANTIFNVLTGGKGNDSLDGGSGADSLVGGMGNDTIVVDDLGDTYSDAGGTTDTIKLNTTGVFVLSENGGFERILINEANNATGNSKANYILGTDGTDTMLGGGGNDTLEGLSGAHADLFVLDHLGAGNIVRIVNYDQANDQIGLASNAVQAYEVLFAGGLLSTEVASNATGVANANGLPQLVYNQTAGTLFYDANGSTAGGQTQIAVFDAAHKPVSLSEADFSDFIGFI